MIICFTIVKRSELLREIVLYKRKLSLLWSLQQTHPDRLWSINKGKLWPCNRESRQRRAAPGADGKDMAVVGRERKLTTDSAAHCSCSVSHHCPCHSAVICHCQRHGARVYMSTLSLKDVGRMSSCVKHSNPFAKQAECLTGIALLSRKSPVYSNLYTRHRQNFSWV